MMGRATSPRALQATSGTVSSAPRPPRLFVRNDDVGELTDPLKRFVDLFLDRGIPVSYQVIPARLTPLCADFMRSAAEAHPELIEFGQHGLRHEMELRGRRLKREFGPERSFEDQRDDILEGLRLLEAGLDRKVVVFTPPQHKYDSNTVRAVAAAGHRIFSAASYPSTHHRLAYALGRGLGLGSIRHQGISYHGRRRPEADLMEVSISIAVDNGRSIQTPAVRLQGDILAAARHSPAVGLMFHHEVYGDPDAQRQLVALADALAGAGAGAFHKICALSPQAVP